MLSIRPAQRGDEARREHPHEAGEADELGAARGERRRERRLEGGAVAAERPVVDGGDRQPEGGGAGEAAGVGAVGEHQADLGGMVGLGHRLAPARPCSSRCRRSGSATRRRITNGPCR